MSASRKLRRKREATPPAKQTPIKTTWEGFDRLVVPPNASDVQRTEMRKAFYSGAAVLFRILTLGVSEGDEPQQSDLDMMDAIQAEIDEFGQELDTEILLKHLRRVPRGET